MRITRLAGAVAAVAALAVSLAACAGSDNTPNGTGGNAGGGSGGKGAISVGSGNFPESEILANMYSQVLKKAGYSVTDKFDVGSREAYIKAMQHNEVDVVPEYIGSLTEYLNTLQNGPDAAVTSPQATGDPEKTFANLKTLLAKEDGLSVTPYAKNATDQNSFAVTKATADKYGLSKMSDLGKPEVQNQLVLGAGADCEKRPFCLAGLEKTYNVKFKESGGKYRKFENPGDSNTLSALQDGTIDLGLVFTSDGSVDDKGLIRLDDDKLLQPSDNICTLARTSKVDATALGLIDKVNQTVTTDDLKKMNKRFNVDKEDADVIAQDYLKDKSLL